MAPDCVLAIRRRWARRGVRTRAAGPRATSQPGARRLPAADDIDRDSRPLLAAAENDAANRADVGVIAAPCQGDVAIDGHAVVGRVGVDPAEARYVQRDPRVRGVDADEAWLVRRRRGLDIAAHVACRQAERPEAGDLQ